MIEITSHQIALLREKTGAGNHHVKQAVIEANGDMDLAEGILKFKGCAVAVTPRPGETREQAYKRWYMAQARGYAQARKNERAL